jgi:hypothetical protein
MSTRTKTRNPVTWFEIHATDPERARSFYGDVFGWSFENEAPSYDMIGMGEGAPIGGGLTAVREGGAPMNVFNVQVEDVAATCDTVVQAGGSVVIAMQTTPTGLDFAYVADPDGSVFGLWKPGN